MNSTSLALKNSHKRDSNITFKDTGHIYTIKHPAKPEGDSGFTSVTTFIHTLFEGFNADKIINIMMASERWSTNKYYGMTKPQIKKLWKDNGKGAAAAGTKLHLDIEYTYNDMDIENDSIEYRHFLKFKEDYKILEPYRTEWIIYHEELRFAGSIDMVFKNADGVLELYDWKRVKEINPNNKWNKWFTNPVLAHLPDTNYWHYALQLNIYKAILMEKYEVLIGSIYLVSLHPENNSYIRIEVPNLQDEIKTLFLERARIIN
jgi:ATP-dependent exoDNAse (exonuclease V) beta subunit